jgi:hypothetical protein
MSNLKDFKKDFKNRRPDSSTFALRLQSCQYSGWQQKAEQKHGLVENRFGRRLNILKVFVSLVWENIIQL